MKKLFFIALFFVSCFSFAQDNAIDYPMNHETMKADFTASDSLPFNKAELYSKAIEWISTNFKNASDVIEYQDKDAGKIIVKGTYQVYSMGASAGFFHFKLTFKIKDNYYKCHITDLRHEDVKNPSIGAFEKDKPGYPWTKGQWNKMRQQAIADANSTLGSIGKAMHASDED
jgi:hypothetical protein